MSRQRVNPVFVDHATGRPIVSLPCYWQEPNSYAVYALCEPTEPHEVRYIGCSGNLAGRLVTHLSAARAGVELPVSRWVAGLLAAGELPWVVVLERTTYGHADTRERHHIFQHVDGGRLLNNHFTSAASRAYWNRPPFTQPAT